MTGSSELEAIDRGFCGNIRASSAEHAAERPSKTPINPWAALTQHAGCAVLALCLPACTWTATDAWPWIAVLLAFYVGLAVGTVTESSNWRSKGQDPPNGGGRMLSNGRLYWVCSEDASAEARQFVAHMLMAEVEAERRGRS